ncbi:integrase family protein [Rhodomicrobium vannielii ATCC 17100]|uniref:Integrase family protein n=1 Tax=Rhodomicrobium vannielii (strain ATCC 17100 / DSM 162 / LMG 4299 / NCIMB 10020 / ATH 3.1.1) TaxID=648757 RepID=E3I103_RHOVT|nr:tyrosine-type recombinase/integrase [Rhodomicrobium vannielii]ADP72326.1 integrase family protein [Rhodomicrobium vannielii ATCC 17100]
MAKGIHRLSAAEVRAASEPGLYADGGGLFLQVSKWQTKAWLFKFTLNGRTRGMGLGAFHMLTLAQARAEAVRLRDKVRSGIDPIEERNAAKNTAGEHVITFEEAAKKYLVKKEAEFRNEKHAKQWASTLETYAMPIIGNMDVAHIELQDVVRVLTQEIDEHGATLWHDRTETASRLRMRIEGVLAWATVSGHRTGDNPARWSGNLKELLPRPGSIAVKGHHPAVATAELPTWFAALKSRDGLAALALQFLALTAARSGEVRGATWQEIDLQARTWRIPASRTKTAREHVVPLSNAAVALLAALPRTSEAFVFPSTKAGAPLSDMSLSAVMRRMPGFVDPQSGRPAVPHGLRSSFRSWCAERGVDHDLAELALAHAVGNKVKRAYQRSDMFKRRVELMEAWSAVLCDVEQANNVIHHVFRNEH